MTAKGRSVAGILPPEALAARHDPSQFVNGRHLSLDLWLRERAAAGEGLSARTYVICLRESRDRVVGYYAIATATEMRAALPTAKLRKGMPEEIPLLLIGRLAVDAQFQGRGLGRDLLVDAVRRCVAASRIVGARAIVTHAIDEEAARFYQAHGFMMSPLGERVMLMPIETARALVDD